ncbi:MAG: 30S ribosomal protein S6 [Elusimicrobia bacterium]|nr:30S ribosomal protein S6 [Elusimicrobiota bacterium]
MLTYETVLILKPVMSDPEVAGFLEKTKQAIAGEGGEVVNHEVWGRRKLTHSIGKAREGIYAYLKYKAGPPLLRKLGHNFGLSEDVLRDMTIAVRDRRVREKKPKKAKPAAAAARA